MTEASSAARPWWLLTACIAIALSGFAANSLLCRLGLADGTQGAADFTLIRMLAGAVVLAFLVRRRLVHDGRLAGDWISAAALSLYAVAFAFAYVALHTGIGALILFGAVQVTMIAWGVVRDERPGVLRWFGFLLAAGGLVALASPGATAPPLGAAAGMALAGAAWGVYSLRGRGVQQPLATTAGNFIRSVPLCVAVWLLCWSGHRWSSTGVLCAIASGALASGLGYACWYTAVGSLSRTTAAIVQLAVPVLAALGGTVLLHEELTLRLLVIGGVVLGGIACATLAPKRG